MPLKRLERQNQMCSNLTKPTLSAKNDKNTKELEKQICSQFSKAANFKIIFSFLVILLEKYLCYCSFSQFFLPSSETLSLRHIGLGYF